MVYLGLNPQFYHMLSIYPAFKLIFPCVLFFLAFFWIEFITLFPTLLFRNYIFFYFYSDYNIYREKANIFSYCFIFFILIVSFDKQKFLTLMKSSFSECFFFFKVHAFCVLRNICLIRGCKDFPSMFSVEISSFYILYLDLWSISGLILYVVTGMDRG